MKITGGTPEALKLIEQLKASGNLIDVYTKEWMTKANNSGFNAKEFDLLVKRYGENFANHLLVVWLQNNDEVNNALIKIYPPLEKILAGDGHRPNFIFINLYSKQLIVTGLGRKNRSFVIPIDEEVSLDTSNLLSNDYIKKFTSLDHKNVFAEICNSIEALGALFWEYDDLCNDSQDDDLSEEEGDEINNQIYELDDKKTKIANVVRNYFPSFDENEINTQDY